MSYLDQRQGAVVDRRDLLREAWGYDVPGGSNVLEANIKSLRRKLGDRSTSIETVRGLGYASPIRRSRVAKRYRRFAAGDVATS